MPSAAEYRAEGFISFGELVERVASQLRVRESLVRDLLPGRLARVKAAMVYTGNVVQPDDFKRRHLYWEGLDEYIATLWRLTNFGSVSLIDSVDLYRIMMTDGPKLTAELVNEIKRKQGLQKPKRRTRKLSLVS